MRVAESYGSVSTWFHMVQNQSNEMLSNDDNQIELAIMMIENSIQNQMMVSSFNMFFLVN